MCVLWPFPGKSELNEIWPDLANRNYSDGWLAGWQQLDQFVCEQMKSMFDEEMFTNAAKTTANSN